MRRALALLLLLSGCPSPEPEPTPTPAPTDDDDATADDDDAAADDDDATWPATALTEDFETGFAPPPPPPCPPQEEPASTWFADVTACAGVTAPHHVPDPDWYPFGAVWADLDGDGHLDLFVTDSGGPDRWFAGDGAGLFVQQAIAAPEEPLGSSGAAAGDLDGDGDLDLLVEGYSAAWIVRNDGGVLTAEDPLVWHEARGSSVALADYDGDGALDAYLTRYSWLDSDPGGMPADDALLLGGEGLVPVDHLPHYEQAGYAFAARFVDLDGDHDLDLYVINDRGSSDESAIYLNHNLYFRNDGPGCDGWCWTEVGRDLGLDLRLNGMGIAIGDVDDDQVLDLAVSDSQYVSLMLQTEFGFIESGLSAGLTTVRESWGVALFDADNDGDLDLFAPCGSMGAGGGQPDVLWLNDGGTFTDVSLGSGLDHGGNSIGAAVADYDGDGWLDLFVGGAEEDGRLLRNLGADDPALAGHHWIAFEIAGGTGLPTPPVGATVVLTDDAGRTQWRDLSAGTGLGVAHSPRLHFGLGDALPTTATVRWPDGRQLVLNDPAPDRLHAVSPP